MARRRPGKEAALKAARGIRSRADLMRILLEWANVEDDAAHARHITAVLYPAVRCVADADGKTTPAHD